jgi:adenylate cyclase
MPTPILEQSAEIQLPLPRDDAALKRQLAAILCADVVDYSRHMQEDEIGTLAALKGHFADLIEPRVSLHGGRIFNVAGDGLLAVFRSAVDALACAVEIQSESERRNAARPDGRQLWFRIGLNLGEVVLEGDDVLGTGVIVAARLQTIARAGGICLSDDLRRQVHGKVDVDFQDLGDHQLKNIAHFIKVFSVVGPASDPTSGPIPGSTPAPALRSTVVSTRGPSLAVLPFDNLSGDPDQAYFSDGITNDLITDLSRFPELGVIASHSVFTYKGKAIDVQEVARDLGVRYVVEGSIQRANQAVRINVQLIDARENRHLWSERYKRDLADLFELQDEIVRSVAAIVATRVEMYELEHIQRQPTESLAAYDVYLRGKAVWFDWTREANLKAQEYLRAAIALDPKFARAYSGLSFVLIQSALGGWAQFPSTTIQEARDLAQRAVALDRLDFEAHAQLGFASLYCRDFRRCITAYEKSLELNPNSADVLAEMADALVHNGRTAEGVAKIAQAKRLNPICPDWYDWVLGIAAFHDGRYEDALMAFEEVHDCANFLRSDLAVAYVRSGRMEDARRVVAEMLKVQPDYTLATDRLRPFKDPQILQSFIADLQEAGLSD